MTDEELKDIQREWSENTIEYRESLARQISKNITIRSYENGNSKDETRPTTEIEADIIYKICLGAMATFGYRMNSDTQSVLNALLDTAEFTLNRFIPEANGYDTIYIPLKKAFGIW